MFITLPLMTYGVPALVQQIGGRGLDTWKKTTLNDTGRSPVEVSQLGAWPCTGGWRKGNGDGFKLIRALAAEVRNSDQIMVGVARTEKLAKKYVSDTDAVASARNPRHVRWP